MTDSASVTSTSKSLIVRLREQDTQAWFRLVRLYTPLVYFWCRKYQLADQDIPDVMQEVFQTVSAKIHQFQKKRESDTFRGWLRTITRCKAVDFFRRQTRQPTGAGGSGMQRLLDDLPAANNDSDDEEDAVQRSVFVQALEFIRAEFHETTWKAFWFVVVDGRPTNDVADELGMRSGTVRVAKSRVLHRLRKELGDLLD